MTLRIAFIGQQRSGKDTAGEIFSEWVVNKFPLTYPNSNMTHVIHYSLAAPIKNICDSAYNYIHRDDCQAIGSKLREYDPAIFIKIVENQVTKDNPKFAMITDVRYPNEVEHLSKLGFQFIGIDAPDEERYLRAVGAHSVETADDWEQDELHESEVQARACLLNAPYVVKNGGTVEAFRKRLEERFEELSRANS